MNDVSVRQFQEAAAQRIQRLLLDHGFPEPVFQREENEEFSYLATRFDHLGHTYDLSIQEDEISLLLDGKHYSSEMAAGHSDRWALLDDFTALLDRFLKATGTDREPTGERGSA